MKNICRNGIVTFLTLTIALLFALVVVLLVVINMNSMDGKNGQDTKPNSGPWSPPTTESGTVNLIKATNGAVAADNEICSNIGVKIMKDLGGNAVDAAIASSFCIVSFDFQILIFQIDQKISKIIILPKNREL